MDNSNDKVYHASDWRDRGLNGQQLNGLRPNIVQLVLLCSPILALVQFWPLHMILLILHPRPWDTGKLAARGPHYVALGLPIAALGPRASGSTALWQQ